MSGDSVAVGIDTALGPQAPLPRSNGELVFEQPWESRAFGMAVGLHREGRFAWEAFRQCLIARIAAWEARNAGEPYAYYAHWLGALEDVIGEAGLLDPSAIDEKADAIATLPDGADHHHGNHHHHHHGDGGECHA